jgi:hypothetical protein
MTTTTAPTRTLSGRRRMGAALRARESLIRRFLEWGGFAAGVIMIAFGVGAIVMGFDGRSTVGDSLSQEKIVGTPDMTPAAITDQAKKAGLVNVDLPDSSVAGQAIDTGAEARTFAEYMRVHALEATGGYTYAEMGRFEAKPNTPASELAAGGGTDNEKYAAVDPNTNGPAANGARDIWVTETGLTTALNASYMAERISVFGIVVGIALFLSGVGFIVMAFAALHRKEATA